MKIGGESSRCDLEPVDPASAEGPGSESRIALQAAPAQLTQAESDLIARADKIVLLPVAPPRFDALTERHLASLRPDLQALAREHLFTLKQAAVEVRIVQGSRTLAEQAQLYAQGRTTPGPIVTNAKAGTSAHNHAAGYDLAITKANLANPYVTLGQPAAPSGVLGARDIPGFPKWDLGHYQLENWRNSSKPR